MFRNPWPESEPHRAGDILRLLGGRLFRRVPPTPPRGSFPTATPAFARPKAAEGELTATWIGHATVLLQIGAHNVLTDPVFGPRAFPVSWAGPRRVMDAAPAIDALPPIDVVAISHNHYDHLDRGSVKHLARAHPAARWVVPTGLGAYVRGWGVLRVDELGWWDELEIDGTRVRATPARHFSARRLGDRNRSLWCGYALARGDRRALFVGDTAYHPEFAAIGEACGPFDLVMMPVGAYDPRWFMKIVHVDPEQAVRAFRELVAPHPGAPVPRMLGIHWGTFRLTDEAMDEPPRRTLAAWRAAGLPEDRLWIARFGETRRG